MKLSEHYMANMFRYGHLTSEEMRNISREFCETAGDVISHIPDESAETNVELVDAMLMKLWEAKNLAVVLLSLQDEVDDE
jgi:hypothetical protein